MVEEGLEATEEEPGVELSEEGEVAEGGEVSRVVAVGTGATRAVAALGEEDHAVEEHVRAEDWRE